jgi:hypothetical protein
MTTCINQLLTSGLIIGMFASVAPCAEKAPPAWQNPDIGLTVDAIADAHDASGSWKSPGVTIRGAELIVSANVDPYAFLLGNVLISQHGAELHEAFAVFPALPLNLRLKGGLMLANFGRWNRFHAHAMPFVSEPRIYKEYAGGMLALRGAELSWLVPIPHYVEITASAYDLIDGHSHDSDPVVTRNRAEEIADSLGAQKHGTHWHLNGQILNEEDLYEIAGDHDKAEPELYSGQTALRGPEDFVYGGRITTSFEFGPSWSSDIGASFLYQGVWTQSQRTDEGFPEFYDKLLWGADIVFFWHPLTANKYRNLQTGVEVLGTRESFEQLTPSSQVIQGWRTGALAHIDYQHTQQWHIGAFGSLFQSNDLNKNRRIHAGGYVTLAITHYQYVRVEYSRFEYPDVLDGVNRIQLQYDATIGYHTHGRQR